jgi:hypothetical protein
MHYLCNTFWTGYVPLSIVGDRSRSLPRTEIMSDYWASILLFILPGSRQHIMACFNPYSVFLLLSPTKMHPEAPVGDLYHRLWSS